MIAKKTTRQKQLRQSQKDYSQTKSQNSWDKAYAENINFNIKLFEVPVKISKNWEFTYWLLIIETGNEMISKDNIKQIFIYPSIVEYKQMATTDRNF